MRAHGCSWGGWDWGSSQQEASAGSCPRESRGSLKGTDSGHCSHLYPFLWPFSLTLPLGKGAAIPLQAGVQRYKYRPLPAREAKAYSAPGLGAVRGRLDSCG